MEPFIHSCYRGSKEKNCGFNNRGKPYQITRFLLRCDASVTRNWKLSPSWLSEDNEVGGSSKGLQFKQLGAGGRKITSSSSLSYRLSLRSAWWWEKVFKKNKVAKGKLLVSLCVLFPLDVAIRRILETNINCCKTASRKRSLQGLPLRAEGRFLHKCTSIFYS